jgi:hypothetical protein
VQANLLGRYLRDHILNLPSSQSCVKHVCKNQLYSIEKINLKKLNIHTARIIRLLIDLTRIKSISKYNKEKKIKIQKAYILSYLKNRL